MISDNIPILSVALGLSQPGKDLVSSTALASLQRILKSLPVSASLPDSVRVSECFEILLVIVTSLTYQQ